MVLGPVLATAAHPDAAALGWDRFSRLIEDYHLPVYDLGGLAPADLERARPGGAPGLAKMCAASPVLK